MKKIKIISIACIAIVVAISATLVGAYIADKKHQEYIYEQHLLWEKKTAERDLMLAITGNSNNRKAQHESMKKLDEEYGDAWAASIEYMNTKFAKETGQPLPKTTLWRKIMGLFGK